jgi:anti-anti-sigma factor
MTVSPFLNLAPVATPDLNRPSAIAVIAIDCELVRGAEDRIIDKLTPRVKQESVALDLSRVERIDAAGIAALITLYCTAIEAGHEFYVVSPSTRVLDMLRLVGLESILVPNDGVPTGEPAETTQSNRRHLRFERSAA